MGGDDAPPGPRAGFPQVSLGVGPCTVQGLFSACLAASTQAVYRSGGRRFLKFCETYQVSPPFPVTESTLSAFMAHLHSGGLALGTVKGYLAAVHYFQIAQGLGDPRIGDMFQLEYVVKGMKRTAPPRSSCTRLPVTPEILTKLKAVWATHQD